MSEPSDTAVPLLRSRAAAETSAGVLAILLGRAAGRRGPSMLVRETAVRELEERRADWGYSKPVVALDVSWNMTFVIASVLMLVGTVTERPNVSVRVWVGGYALQCLIHVVLVWAEYRRRRRMRRESGSGRGRGRDSGFETRGFRGRFGFDDNDSEGEDGAIGVFGGSSSGSSFAKKCESVNTMASFLWWMVGFYWVISGGKQLLHDAPRLYWLAVVYLAFDVFFAIFCVVLACLIGIALCCCLPCIIAILYAVAGQEGASEAELNMLPKYKFRTLNNDEKRGGGGGLMVPVVIGSGYLGAERVLLSEDAECCICLCPYDDGVELHALPCNHHFHTTCIVKWLKMNATCPLCKYDILNGNAHV